MRYFIVDLLGLFVDLVILVHQLVMPLDKTPSKRIEILEVAEVVLFKLVLNAMFLLLELFLLFKTNPVLANQPAGHFGLYLINVLVLTLPT